MDNDTEQFDQAAPSSGSDWAVDDAEALFGAIGYEAADPSLQAPLWHETMQGLPNKRDWR